MTADGAVDLEFVDIVLPSHRSRAHGQQWAPMGAAWAPGAPWGPHGHHMRSMSPYRIQSSWDCVCILILYMSLRQDYYFC